MAEAGVRKQAGSAQEAPRGPCGAFALDCTILHSHALPRDGRHGHVCSGARQRPARAPVASHHGAASPPTASRRGL